MLQIRLLHAKIDLKWKCAIAGYGYAIESETWFDRQSSTDQTEKYTKYIGVTEYQNRCYTIHLTQRLLFVEQCKWKQ